LADVAVGEVGVVACNMASMFGRMGCKRECTDWGAVVVWVVITDGRAGIAISSTGECVLMNVIGCHDVVSFAGHS
jgi:hypothetical protein